MKASDHLLGRWTGSHWFMGMVALILICLFSLWLVAALLDAQELAERMVVENTVRNMRTGLMVAKGEAMIAGRENEIAGWVGANPVQWLGELPGNYAGDCPSGGVPDEGMWCFDARLRQLLYWPRHGRHLQLIGQPAGGEEKILRWQVAGMLKSATAGGSVSVSVELVTLYRWQLE